VSAPDRTAWLDVSIPLRAGIAVWPGDPELTIARVAELERGDEARVSTLAMSVHTGTHVDAPAHFLREGATLDAMPLDATVGPARVLGVREPGAVSAAALRRARIRRGERVLLRTRNSGRDIDRDGFDPGFTALDLDAARLLAERRVRCVGIDAPSVAAYGSDQRMVHETLLAAGVWIIEGLDLRRVPPGAYDLVCLPLRLVGTEGAPARALLRRRGTSRRRGR
jgi:arylformamidase